MPIPLRPSLALALLALAAPAGAQTNPLEGDTQAPQAAVAVDASGGLVIPTEARGQLLPDPDNAATGGVAFADEEGWYRFTMPNGGRIDMAGPMRSFIFDAGTIETKCAAQRLPDGSFAAFTMAAIQAEIDTLYEPFDALIAQLGFTIENRATMVLDTPGQRSAIPLKLLGWDTRSSEDVRATWAIMPAPAGLLLFACSGADPGHHREVMRRYLRIGSGMTTRP
jgi:hypothetical protein